MDAERFAKGFERPPRDYASLRGKEWIEARDALVDPSIRWSHFFSHLLDSYLKDKPIDFADARRAIGIYTGNSTRNLLTNTIQATERAATYKPALLLQLNRMNFHTINQEMGDAWLHIINPEAYQSLDFIHLTAIQARLAVSALQLIETRRRISNGLLRENPGLVLKEVAIDQSFAGRITELDAAITLLQVVKDLPFDESGAITVLPAPSKYEGFQNRGSDFIILDTIKRQARGIQVKTRKDDTNAYDDQYISMVYGVEDLGNYVQKKHARDGAGRRSAPGLIAADFILNSEELNSSDGYTHLPEFQGTSGLIAHARTVAETMQSNLIYSGRAALAAASMTTRLMYALRKDSGEEKTKPDIWSGLDEA